jgi:hypothetical protein
LYGLQQPHSQQFGLGAVDVAIGYGHLVSLYNPVEYALFGRGIQFVGVGKAHEGHPEIADAEASILKGLDEKVYHVAIFVVKRHDHLPNARAFLPQAETAANPLFRGV